MSIKLTPMQVQLYKYYMENKTRSNDENTGRKGSILFQDFQNLQRIWTAPLVMRYNSDKYEQEMQRRRDMEDDEEESEGSLKDFIDDSESAASTSSSSSDDVTDDDASIHSDEPKKVKKKKKNKKEKAVPLPRRTRAMAAERKF
jgi:transcriptional regulator ATRX